MAKQGCRNPQGRFARCNSRAGTRAVRSGARAAADYYIRPYLPGRGPTVGVVLGTYPEVYAIEGRKRTLVFREGPYRSGMGGSSKKRQVADIISFAVAYAESPEEFDRSPSDIEQIHRGWWVRHGGAISAELVE